MKQIFLIEPGKIELKDMPIPDPGEGEIVIKVNNAMTCGTDLKAYLRGHELIPMPGPFGHEYSGTVFKTGKGVKEFSEGDNVMGVHSAPCQTCSYCIKGMYNLCENIMETKVLGAYAEYLLLPEHIVSRNLFLKPDNVDFQEAALIEPFSCVLHPYKNIELNQTETALVIGAGSVGLMHLAYLKKLGITAIVNDISGDRLAAAVRMGADMVTDIDNLESLISEKTEKTGVDLVIECTGKADVWEQSVNYVRRGGTVILFGGCPAGTKVQFDTHRLHYDELTIMGSFHYTRQDVHAAYQMISERSVNLSPIISKAFPLKDTAEAFELLRQGKGIKYAIRP